MLRFSPYQVSFMCKQRTQGRTFGSGLGNFHSGGGHTGRDSANSVDLTAMHSEELKLMIARQQKLTESDFAKTLPDGCVRNNPLAHFYPPIAFVLCPNQG